MFTLPSEVLTGLQENTIAELYLSVAQERKVLEFMIIIGDTELYVQIELSKKLLHQIRQDTKNNQYSATPIFSDASFNELKDALILNTSLIKFKESDCSVFSKEQYEYIKQISRRNREACKNNMTLFHYAAAQGDIAIVQAHVWKAKELNSLNVKCRNNKTPLDYARENNQFIIVEFLQHQMEKFNVASMRLHPSTGAMDDEPLSEQNKLHIFNSLRLCIRLKDDFKQILIDAALENAEFPPVFKDKLAPLQLAYSANTSSLAVRSLLASAIVKYFEEEGLLCFNELLNGPFIESEWCSNLMKILANGNIIIAENPYVLATIQNGKIYWCVVFGTRTIYRRPTHATIIAQAITDNRTWRLTWDEFRRFKDGGKRTGTVPVTKERFVETIDLGEALAKKIWEELLSVGILNEKFCLSQEWYAFSGEKIILNCVDIKKDNKIYQKIADALQNITRNQDHSEVVARGMEIYRPARVSKIWASTGRVTQCHTDNVATTKLWDVGVYRELRDQSIPQKPPCRIDHIPSRSQVKMMCQTHIDQCLQEMNTYTRINPRELRNPPQDLLQLQKKHQNLKTQLETFENDKKGLPLWSVYIPKEIDDTGDTTGTCKKAQKDLSFYSSVKKHIDDLKKGLKTGAFTLNQVLHALGAFRYMYSRMCKPISHINKQNFIHDISYSFFGPGEKSNDRKQMDNLFIEEMKSFQEVSFNTSRSI